MADHHLQIMRKRHDFVLNNILITNGAPYQTASYSPNRRRISAHRFSRFSRRVKQETRVENTGCSCTLAVFDRRSKIPL